MLCSEAGIFLKWSRRTNSAKSPNQKQRLFGSTLKRHTLPVPVMLSSKRIMDHGFLVFFGIRFNQIFGVVCACCCTRPVFQGLLSVHRSVLTCEKNGTQTFFFLCLFPFWKCFLWFRVPTGDPFVLFDAERLQGNRIFLSDGYSVLLLPNGSDALSLQSN